MQTVPGEVTGDPLWRSEVYRLALYAGHVAWDDASRLAKDPRTVKLSGQLYAAVGSIAATFAGGYSRQSHRDQARFYEYSLGSAREARVWYFHGQMILGPETTEQRFRLLTSVIRLLLRIIPAERAYVVREDAAPYEPSTDGPVTAPPPDQ